MAAIHITYRAAIEISEIEKHSRGKWGKSHAVKYINDLDKALTLLKEHPGLLQDKPAISRHLKFYTSGEHVMVFQRIRDDIYLVTVMHSKMELDKRVPELEPTLEREVEITHAKMIEAKKGNHE